MVQNDTISPDTIPPDIISHHAIIDHRPIGRLYGWWVVLTVLLCAMAGLAYYLQLHTPYNTERDATLFTWMIILSVLSSVLAMMFKWIFWREVIAWWFAIVIGACGLVVFLFYGWNILFWIFFAVALIWLVVMGPYLYFK